MTDLNTRIEEAANLTNARNWEATPEQLLFCESLLDIDETELGWKAYDRAIHALEDKFICLLAENHPLDEAKVGDGATHTIWTDSKAATIIHRTAKSITIQYDEAILLNGMDSDAEDKLHADIGGFAAHVSGQQRYRYKANPNGGTSRFTRREIKGRSGKVVRVIWKQVGSSTRSPGNTLTAGRNHHYDYNF